MRCRSRLDNVSHSNLTRGCDTIFPGNGKHVTFCKQDRSTQYWRTDSPALLPPRWFDPQFRVTQNINSLDYVENKCITTRLELVLHLQRAFVTMSAYSVLQEELKTHNCGRE
jgi:hypothetical protein